ncbi:MAG: hypothetical protein DMF63_03100 [Acidobacteria bacterium]|nr:MAG: hypothetical protein DMF63_03100 [Acidobacteriota bacterium]
MDIDVFLTNEALFCAGTTSWLIRVGRVVGAFTGSEEVSDFVLSIVSAALGGWFRGLLEVDFTIRGLSWAEVAAAKTKLINSAQTDRYEIFFKLFKTYTPKFFS